MNPYEHELNFRIGIINASPVAMGLLTTSGPPSWHPASPQVKARARTASELAKSLGTTLERAALGFSLKPKDTNITTTLVSMPTRGILQENLEIVTKPLTEKDEGIYESLIELFSPLQPCSWEGVEAEEYKKWRKQES